MSWRSTTAIKVINEVVRVFLPNASMFRLFVLLILALHALSSLKFGDLKFCGFVPEILQPGTAWSEDSSTQ